METLLQTFNKLKNLPLAKTLLIKSEKDLSKIPTPYYMKIDSGKHKLKSGGVIKINNQKEATKNLKKLKEKFPKTNIIIQKEIKGTEMVIGIKENKVFGKMLMIGFGGSSIEEKKDVEFRAIPINKEEIKQAIEQLKNYNQIKNKTQPLTKFTELAYKISKLNFNELDLNPVILTKDKAIIVDARSG